MKKYQVVLFLIGLLFFRNCPVQSQLNDNSVNLRRPVYNINPEPKNEKYLRFFAGSGIHVFFYSKDYVNALFTFGITPQFSKHFFLTARIDAHKMEFHEIIEVLYGIGPTFGIDFDKRWHFSGSGIVTFHTMGERGADFSVIPSLGLEYRITDNFALGTELRKPVYFWHDSGHNQLFLNFNLVIMTDIFYKY